jgi:hypothetical protein
MSLPLLVIIVAFGIALSVAAVHFTGGSRTATLASADQALERFAEDFPDDLATAVRLTVEGRTAFLDLARGRIGIVHCIGDCFLTRIVTPGNVVALTAADAATISLRLDDFTWKGGRFTFANAADAKAVVAELGPRNAEQAKEAA